jgi:hypothetical protein
MGASLIVLAIPAAAGCTGKHGPDGRGEPARTGPEITPEEARAALLKLDSLRVVTGGEFDPVVLDLKFGAISRTNASVVTIGKFFSCNLKAKTWQMGLRNPQTHFGAGASGRFEFQSDGRWRAIKESGYIT